MPIAILSMNKATARPLLEDPHRCAYQERLGGRHATIQDYEFCVIILFFFCFAICVIRYPTTRRPMSREDAHRMYPRYPRVFLYVIIYCPLPHQSLENGWGYHCRVLVRLLALYAKLNCFLPKKTASTHFQLKFQCK